jgi:phosphotransferase system enzyme I (PtsI)
VARARGRDSRGAQVLLKGIPASPGIVIGPAHVYDAKVGTVESRRIPPSEIESEVDRFLAAVVQTKRQVREIRSQVEEQIDMAHGAIFDSHLRVLEDPMLIDKTVDEIRAERLNAEFIFHRNIQHIGSLFAKIKDQHFRDRDADLLDVGQGVTQNLLGRVRQQFGHLQREVVVIAHELSPTDTAQMGHSKILGFVCATGGPTGHAAIMAKALDLPAVVGVSFDPAEQVVEGELVIVDGTDGLVIINPTAEMLGRYRRARTRAVRTRRSMQHLRDLPAETTDGYRITISANIELAEEVPHVIDNGAQGVGLFRTEFLFLNAAEPPNEDEQTIVYTDVARRLKPEPVIFRTIDLGGDKFLSATNLGQELNPFLGLRAIRLCLDRTDLFLTQLRAIIRASARGNVQVMLPMVSGIEEVREARRIFNQARAELLDEGVPIAEHIPLGIMIETPSAALTADILAREVDFFSIGTNDLIQYTLAVDRVNEKVAYLYQPLHPAVLRLMRSVIDAAHREGIWVGVCGEVAADPEMVPVLLGLGVDELSMSAVAVPRIKKRVRELSLGDCQEVFAHLISKETIHEVQSAARRRRRRGRRTEEGRAK